MTFDLKKIFESKRQFRRELAALPIQEKLRLLDALRERHLTLANHRAIQKFPPPLDGDPSVLISNQA